MKVKVLVAQWCPTLLPDGLEPARLLCLDSPGTNTGVGCRFFLQRTFPTQGSNLGLLHRRQILYHLSHQANLHRLQAKSEPSPMTVCKVLLKRSHILFVQMVCVCFHSAGKVVYVMKTFRSAKPKVLSI